MKRGMKTHFLPLPLPFSYKKSPLFLIAEDGPSIEPLPLTETEDSREG